MELNLYTEVDESYLLDGELPVSYVLKDLAHGLADNISRNLNLTMTTRASTFTKRFGTSVFVAYDVNDLGREFLPLISTKEILAELEKRVTK